MSTYTMIATSSIISHENNPRTQLGDLNELIQSIKANGILQHLTVVPAEDGMFKCIIGHRRLAAAKKAGLTEVPCVVEDFDEKQQIATMMCENMQRAQLTAREEALGFQMMIDLGDNTEAISKRTGFSKTTIGHRVKMLRLDDAKMKEAESRGATIGDYIKLEKIKDIAVRNEVLDSVGTENFNAKLNKAIQKQEREEKIAEIEKKVKTFAKKIETYGEVDGEKVEMYHVTSYYDWDKDKEVEVLTDGDYFYTVSSGVSIYKAGTRPAYVESEEARMKREEQERVEKSVKDIEESCAKLRQEFADIIPCKKFAKEITKFYMDMSCTLMNARLYNEVDWSVYYDSFIHPEEDVQPEKAMLNAAMMIGNVLNTKTYDMSWENCHRVFKFHTNDNLEKIYEHLEAMGYQASAMETYYCTGDIADIANIPEEYLVKSGEENT